MRKCSVDCMIISYRTEHQPEAVEVFAVVRAELMVLEVIPESGPRLVVCVEGGSEVGGTKTPSRRVATSGDRVGEG